jgi:organic radical activating enzyme
VTTKALRNYYCSMKFKYLKIDLTSQTSYNCHAATPHKINFEWLRSNPGQLFNTEINVSERRMMLDNQRNSSCEQNCWKAEDIGAVSPRMYQHGIEQTHIDSVTTPEIIDITVNSECNLTCSYCCKEFSRSWRQDLITHGDYKIVSVDDDRYSINKQDRLLELISQKEMHRSDKYQLLLAEIQLYAGTLKKIDITGGEPLLDNQLLTTLELLNLPTSCKINLYTGLGVEQKRFERIITRLSKIPNLHIKVSAEGIEKFAEFNRYGIQWKEFQQKINVLSQMVDYSFHCTITNLTVMGFANFYQTYMDIPKVITFAYQPAFMATNVLDEHTKNHVQDQLSCLPEHDFRKICQALAPATQELDRQALKDFLTRFIKYRKDINLSIFPKTFVDWMKL